MTIVVVLVVFVVLVIFVWWQFIVMWQFIVIIRSSSLSLPLSSSWLVYSYHSPLSKVRAASMLSHQSLCELFLYRWALLAWHRIASRQARRHQDMLRSYAEYELEQKWARYECDGDGSDGSR